MTDRGRRARAHGGVTHPEIGRAYREVLTLASGLVLARKPHFLSLLAADGESIHLDLEGRLHRAWLDGRSYQRGLDGRVRRTEIHRRGPFRTLEIDLLDQAETDRILRRVTEAVAAAASELPSEGGPAALAEPLARAAAWDLDRYRQEESRFKNVYAPIPILPPDQNRALVIQLTTGCAWNRCTFCHLYRDSAFALKSPSELRTHVRGVLDLAGCALPLRRGVFLGQANALAVKQSKLLPLIDLVRDELEWQDAPRSLLSFSSFIDAFSTPKTADELKELRAHGLTGVTLGIESGSAEVLACLGKPMEAGDAIRLANGLREAGIALGIIILAGAGGQGLAAAHMAGTLEMLARMSPGPDDRVYISPLIVHPGSAYEARAASLGILDGRGLVDQARAFKTGLRRAGVLAPIAFYNIRRFIY